jgi:hypothetical protein
MHGEVSHIEQDNDYYYHCQYENNIHRKNVRLLKHLCLTNERGSSRKKENAASCGGLAWQVRRFCYLS